LAVLSASEGALRKRAAGAERELGEAAAEKEGQMLALEAERERAVRGRDEAETELLRLIEANERLQARIKVRSGAALREGEVRVDVSLSNPHVKRITIYDLVIRKKNIDIYLCDFVNK
jgi:predicted  nucleic acid-binding Zn-ribbon protein